MPRKPHIEIAGHYRIINHILTQKGHYLIHQIKGSIQYGDANLCTYQGLNHCSKNA